MSWRGLTDDASSEGGAAPSNKRMNLSSAAWYRRASLAGYPQCSTDHVKEREDDE